jgi:hypothetical protein
MERTTLLRPSRAHSQRCLWGAAMALCCAAAQAQSVDSNAFAVAFSGGDTSGPAGVVNRVLLNVEVVNDEQTAEPRDFLSMSLIVDVDCRSGRERLRKAEAFDLPNLAGPPQPRGVSGQWETPEAYMGEVIKTICATHGMRIEQGAGAGGRALAVARGPTSPPELPKLRAPAAPANPPEPAFSSAVSPARISDREPEAAPAAPVTAPQNQPFSPEAAAGFLAKPRVQIASSASRADAVAMLGRSASLILPPLRGAVEVATVRGKTVYRSIIGPFGSESEAQAFCAGVRPRLDGCFVWQAR